jgi:hypothetical protein
MFYKATVQTVLLYRTEMWCLPPLSLKCLEGFHICAMWGMMGKWPRRIVNELWTYPCLEEALQAATLKTIAQYVEVHCQTVANFIIKRLIYELCAETVRKRGLPV